MTAVSDGNVWIAAGDKGLVRIGGKVKANLPDAHLLGVGGENLFCFSRKKGEVLNLKKEQWLAAAPGLESMCLSKDGRFLYELSGEADVLICVDMKSGNPLYLTKCGCFPQGLCLHPTGSWLAAATGAAGEIKIYQAPKLYPDQTYRVPGIAARVVFSASGLVFLSAVEKGEIHTLLGLIRHGTNGYEEVALYKGLPGDLLALPDGSVMLSVFGQLLSVKLKPYKLLFAEATEGLVTHIARGGGKLLLTDSVMGQVSLLPLSAPHEKRLLYQGDWVHGVFV